MRPKTASYFADILDAGQFILDAIGAKTLADYRTDRLLRQAVERNFEIIGEAVRRIADHELDALTSLENYAQIISFRNLLIHSYDLIDDEQVFKVAIDQLPQLVRSVSRLLEGDDS